MNATLIRRFIEATQNVFSTMLATQISFDTPVPTSSLPSTGDVSSIIGFSGDVAGAAALRFPLASALKIVEAFTGEAFDEESEDFADAIGELANMICGGAKSNLDNACVNISCPQVVIGKDHKIQKPSDAISISIPCKTPRGDFFIEVSVRSSDSQKSSISASQPRAAAG